MAIRVYPAGPKGRNIGLVQNRIYDGILDNAGHYANMPSTTIAAVAKVYTVPAGHVAVFRPAFTNPTVGAITAHVYAMADAATTPTIADRIFTGSISAGVSTSSNEGVLDEGGSLWVWASAVNLNFMPYIKLIPKTQMLGTWTPKLIKDMATSDTQIYPVSPAVLATGQWAQATTLGLLHNVTGGAIVVTTKLQRAADGAAFAVGVASVGANTTTSWLGGFPDAAPLQAGDKLFVAAAATGINLLTLFCERPVAGL